MGTLTCPCWSHRCPGETQGTWGLSGALAWNREGGIARSWGTLQGLQGHQGWGQSPRGNQCGETPKGSPSPARLESPQGSTKRREGSRGRGYLTPVRMGDPRGSPRAGEDGGDPRAPRGHGLWRAGGSRRGLRKPRQQPREGGKRPIAPRRGPPPCPGTPLPEVAHHLPEGLGVLGAGEGALGHPARHQPLAGVGACPLQLGQDGFLLLLQGDATTGPSAGQPQQCPSPPPH